MKWKVTVEIEYKNLTKRDKDQLVELAKKNEVKYKVEEEK